jgi:hypothetical protein
MDLNEPTVLNLGHPSKSEKRIEGSLRYYQKRKMKKQILNSHLDHFG